MRRFTVPAALVLAGVLTLAACTATDVEANPTGTPPASAEAVENCPEGLLDSISAEVSPTPVKEVEVSPEVMPDGIEFEPAPTCAIAFDVPLGAGAQLFYVGADSATLDRFSAAIEAAGYPASTERFGSVDDGIAGAVWYKDGNTDRASTTTVVSGGWVSGSDIEGAPADAAVIGQPYLVLTISQCPCVTE